MNDTTQSQQYVPAAPGWFLKWHLDNGAVIGSHPIIAWEVPSGKPILLHGKSWTIGPWFWKEYKIVSPTGAVFGDPEEAADFWSSWDELRADMARHPDYWKGERDGKAARQ